MERELPIINIEGTEFIVDALKDVIREKANPQNVIDIQELHYVGNGNGYTFFYDLIAKNIPTQERTMELAFTDSKELKQVKIPELTSIDPLGMAQRYNLDVECVKGKIDFELTIKPGTLLDLRWNKGVLPQLDIAGHTFYVDIQMDKLRPKDDFLSEGIVFSNIKHFYDQDTERYFIPYDPNAHEFRDINYDRIKQIPKDLIVVSFPHETILDPVGANKKYGFDPANEMKESGLRMNFKATLETWAHIYVPEKIKENLHKAQKGSKKEQHGTNIGKPRKRGRSL